MILVRPAEVAAVAGVLSTFTDWLLAGDWLQTRFGEPEMWRARGGLVSVLLSTAMPFITSAGFTLLVLKFDLVGLRSCLKLAGLLWIIGPLPMIASNAVFLNRARVFGVLHATSWLVKLMIVAVLVGRFIH